MNRLRELDFLRGIAIILVLFRHEFLFSFTQKIGWIGVDLFFVLSGFLVSGLLFREYIKFGNIKPGRFLIRRGFKIYPVYYLFYTLYLFRIVSHGPLNITGFLSDMTFTQNYVWGWGYAFVPIWSLAIEEHFYFGFSLVLWLILKYSPARFKINSGKPGPGKFERGILVIMLICLGLRFWSNIAFPEQTTRNFTMTHLRIDSLLAGVLIAYLYYFKTEYLKSTFNNNKYLLLIMFIAGVCWTAFLEPEPSFFVKTVGFSLLYVSFSILLTTVLLVKDINYKLNRIFSRPVVNLVSKIGYCSYSIYIIHSFINAIFGSAQVKYHLFNHPVSNFMFTSIISVTAGMVMTYYIENFFLKIRDKHYPSRAA